VIDWRLPAAEGRNANQFLSLRRGLKMVKRPRFSDAALPKNLGLRRPFRKRPAERRDYPPGFFMARLCKINTALTEMKA
jgi:hypothetical protein